ncbi:YbfB/YjiJ family MFS transporter [Propionimicrobium sp. PCR01-08-3]|uniref:YbfB/YjiJ family MFS transporter n=1 Tax=Propionimicrobium sp. PCR01-08-3 TaxID=3052086 RepID=UPI00255C5D94|nr:YbfB/YjiJ family MFS transporter [Propionimicrobium sp. PCR01-08-3]WIY82021.1 YbfB/YjiJ family MFS transporter [Propionimicrobium sp. PCR01-08-3]
MVNGRARVLTAQVTAGFAVAMGIGRFVYTPILPIMATALALPAAWTSWIAAANYLGYLIGALLLSRYPAWISTTLLRTSLVLVVATLAVMPWSEGLIWFCATRLLSGLASAFVFVCLSHSAIDIGRKGGEPGLAYGGVGVGICLSGLLVLGLGTLTWDALWYVSAGLAAVLTVPACAIRLPTVEPAPASGAGSAVPEQLPGRAGVRSRRALMVTYFLEGVGYIIVGTYLVAVVQETTTTEIATSVWVVAGVAAIVSPAIWRRLRLRASARMTFAAAYTIQLGAALLPLISGSAAAAFVAAALFGATFMGITQLSISEAHELRIKSAPARLTAVYGLGQILGPILVAPVIGNGYSNAFILATALLIGCVLGSLLLPAKR